MWRMEVPPVKLPVVDGGIYLIKDGKAIDEPVVGQRLEQPGLRNTVYPLLTSKATDGSRRASISSCQPRIGGPDPP